jgi:uncharacterized membrane protein
MENPHVVESYARNDLDRLISFSDGVYAVAITLLALSFKLPQVAMHENAAEFNHQLLLLDAPILAGYILSFIVVGMYWIAHHRVIRYIVRMDSRLMWYNVFLLLFVGLIPFATQLTQTYGDIPLSNALYAGDQALIGIMQFFLWYHASKGRRLIASDLSQNTIAVLRLRTAVAPVIFLLSIPLVYLDPSAPIIVWTVLIFLRRPILLCFPSFRAGRNNPELVKW